MASLRRKVKAQKPSKFTTRKKNICQLCGRARGYLRRFRMCRICFRELALRGEVPGYTKASW